MYLPKRQRGFTLIETAIVLVIVGLLVAGTVVGAELLGSARSRALIAEIDGFKGAYFGFLDRYGSSPGDYANAIRNVPHTTVDGNGNGLIESMASGAAIDEHIAVWEHLSGAGFISSGRYRYSAGVETMTSAPKVTFGAYPRIIAGQQFAGAASIRNNINTGNLGPANVLAEIDRKMDDGSAITGVFRFSAVDTVGAAPVEALCVRSSNPEPGGWLIGSVIETNCGATWLL
ncbi:MAG: prepilin-type N-terminal cleavage/methylation domain-containing protein [Betaproteobacteria bacterium]